MDPDRVDTALAKRRADQIHSNNVYDPMTPVVHTLVAVFSNLIGIPTGV